MTYATEATYCPEDNKLRLYCGRVPREEYLELRSLGFKSTPKQDCDFVATWSVRAEDKALSMLEDGDTIGDEDQSPADRAADRAERFTGYLNKRRAEATGHADSFESGPSVHGYQSQAGAERAANKHDRQRVKAYSQWDKAEYWQSRTAGVIDNALYKTSAHVRRGRILELEKAARQSWNSERYQTHLERRLDYERTMLEAQGGSVADVEIVPGGHFGGYMVLKVNKSRVTSRAVSCLLYKNGNADTINIQRFGEDAYTPPTPEDLETLATVKAEIKAATQKANGAKPKLINPTDEDAEALQKLLNERMEKSIRARGSYYADKELKFTGVKRMTQAEYSARSKGSYARYQTEYLRENGTVCISQYGYRTSSEQDIPANICKIRTGPCTSSDFSFNVRSIVIITDKPQKPLPEYATEQAEAVAS